MYRLTYMTYFRELHILEIKLKSYVEKRVLKTDRQDNKVSFAVENLLLHIYLSLFV